MQYIIFVGYDLVRIAAISGFAFFIAAIVGGDHSHFTVLLQPGHTAWAMTARIDKTTDTGGFPNLKLRYLAANFRNFSHDLVAGHHREYPASPFVTHLVNIGVAYAAISYLDLHVVRPGLPPVKLKRFQRNVCFWRGIPFCWYHHLFFW